MLLSSWWQTGVARGPARIQKTRIILLLLLLSSSLFVRNYSKENFGLHIYGEPGTRAYNVIMVGEPAAASRGRLAPWPCVWRCFSVWMSEGSGQIVLFFCILLSQKCGDFCHYLSITEPQFLRDTDRYLRVSGSAKYRTKRAFSEK